MGSMWVNINHGTHGWVMGDVYACLFLKLKISVMLWKGWM